MKRKTELFEYLSKRSGLPIYEEIEITIEEFSRLKYRPNLWAKKDEYEYSISRKHIKGGELVFVTNLCKFSDPLAFKELPLDFPFDKIFYKEYRSIDDFKIPYTISKRHYKECEGGGWYSNQPIIVVDNLEFINI